MLQGCNKDESSIGTVIEFVCFFIGKGGGGAGTQGREVKTKATKKKYGKTKDRDVDSDEEAQPACNKSKTPVVPFLSIGEIEKEIHKHVQDVPDEFIQEIAARLHRYHINNHISVLQLNSGRVIFFISWFTDIFIEDHRTEGEIKIK